MSQWLLAFDASCSSCREISEVVGRASGGLLEIVPLGRSDVEQWRVASLGPSAKWAPTLLLVGDGETRAWTGIGMAIPLLRWLGLTASMRVLIALGELRTQSLRGRPLISRSRFLQLGAGATVVAGVMLAGKSPAAVAERSRIEAREWVTANSSQLPTDYDEVIALGQPLRREVYAASSPAVRSRLWVTQLKRWRGNSSLSGEQITTLDKVLEIAADESYFGTDPDQRRAVRPALDSLREEVGRTFDKDAAHQIFASLGQPVVHSAEEIPCDICRCSTEDDWCDAPAQYCRQIQCHLECDQPHGCYCFSQCGFLLAYECNGYCEIVT